MVFAMTRRYAGGLEEPYDGFVEYSCSTELSSLMLAWLSMLDDVPLVSISIESVNCIDQQTCASPFIHCGLVPCPSPAQSNPARIESRYASLGGECRAITTRLSSSSEVNPLSKSRPPVRRLGRVNGSLNVQKYIVIISLCPGFANLCDGSQLSQYCSHVAIAATN